MGSPWDVDHAVEAAAKKAPKVFVFWMEIWTVGNIVKDRSRFIIPRFQLFECRRPCSKHTHRRATSWVTR